MDILVYNTMTKQKEVLKPLEPGHVKMYLCGPTVYSFVHVGNTRGPIVFNFVRNFLEKKGYKVTLVYNYTDVDDKIIEASKKEGVPADEIANRYIKEFERDFELMGLRKATHNPRVTETMPEIIELVSNIIKNGYGYASDGDVYFSVEKMKDYGKLSHKNIDELMVGARVEIGEKKRNPLDFALWKAAKPGEPSWESPWGEGRPGWHIECSAMSKKFLGETFDIHGGGIDLIFPHHENEIAQSEAGNGKKFVQVWMHNNFINLGKEKMSKSLGNIFTARQFLETYNGEILKFLMLSSHYRSPSDFSEAVIQNAIAGLARVYSSLSQAERWLERCQKAGFTPNGQAGADEKNLGAKIKELPQKVDAACSDDFNSPEVLAEIFNCVRGFNNIIRPGLKPSQGLANSCRQFIDGVKKVGELMSLFQQESQSFLVALDDIMLKEKGLERAMIDEKVAHRVQARANKDFATSDRLRDELVGLGIELRDSQEGTEWEVKK